jgi:hypothetical protein
MRNSFFCILVSLSSVVSLAAQTDPTEDIIKRARATLGSEEALDAVVTLRFEGRLEPADPQVDAANILIMARKPSSQRLEIRVDDMVETTILNGKEGCIIRTNLLEDRSKMRALTDMELERVLYSTRQFFNYYQPDYAYGEQVVSEGIMTHRGERSHKLRYVYPNGFETLRFFSVAEDRVVSVVAENGVESVNQGEQFVKGIKFPERIEYFEGDRKLHTIVLSRISVNEPLPAGIFDIPSAPSPPTALGSP